MNENTLYICCECGCGDDLQTIDGKNYCRDCADKTPCYECNAMCGADEMKMGDYKELMYCESCWNERFDNCYKCGEMVVTGQELPPYEYDKSGTLQCVCDDCRNGSIKAQRNKLLEFCRAEGIDERLVKSLDEINKL